MLKILYHIIRTSFTVYYITFIFKFKYTVQFHTHLVDILYHALNFTPYLIYNFFIFLFNMKFHFLYFITIRDHNLYLFLNSLSDGIEQTLNYLLHILKIYCFIFLFIKYKITLYVQLNILNKCFI